MSRSEQPPPPTGTVTFLFTDIEGSTGLAARLGERFRRLLDDHHRLLREAVGRHRGVVVDTAGDGFFVAFERVRDAASAAVAAQRALAGHAWPGGEEVRVRMGMHAAEAPEGPPYVGVGVHRAARIAAAAHGGQVLLSGTARDLLEPLPPGLDAVDLGAHELRGLDGATALFQLVAHGLAAAFPPVRTEGSPGAAPLPVLHSPTHGRGAEIAGLAAELPAMPGRLLTLSGPGGVGKTRLAVEVARAAAPSFAGGAHFVALAGVADPGELLPALARALHAPGTPGEPLAGVVARRLRRRPVLLVLDNLEQLVAGAGVLADLLERCPDLTVLATSREPLRLHAERVHVVEPLDDDGAVALFCDRARSHDASFALDAAGARHVAEICRRLDGLPLALELAAARVALLSPAELAGRLDRTLPLLVGGAADAPARQRTMRAAIDWSFEALDDAGRAAFVRMAALPGGGTVTLAEEVTGAGLETLESLVAKHLIRRREGRLTMLAPVREYALERLAADPDRDVVQRRLAAWCEAFAGAHVRALERAERPSALARLDAELPNALAAIQHALDAGDAQTALGLVTAWAPYWRHAHGGRQSGLRWLDAALGGPGDASEHLRTRARLEHVELAGLRREDREAHHAELVDLVQRFRADADPEGVARSLAQLAWFHAWSGDVQRAEALVGEAIEAAESTGDGEVLATVMAHTTGALGSYEAMAPRARAALAQLDRVGHVGRAAHASGITGYLAIVEGRYEEALPWLDRAMEVVERSEDLHARYVVSENEALARVLMGDLAGAAHFYEIALRVARTAGAGDIIDEALLGVAVLRAQLGDRDVAARLAGAAARHETRGRAHDETLVLERLAERVGEARAADPQRWARLEAEGARLSLDEAVDLALATLARAGATSV